MIKITIPLEPYGKKSPETRIIFPKDKRKKPFAVIYTRAETRNYEAAVKKYALAAMGHLQPFEGPLSVLMDAIYPVPSSWSDAKANRALSGVIRPVVKPDWDNISKVVGDAFNGVVWIDDSHVVDGRVRKWYGRSPAIIVTVRATEIGLFERDEDAA